MSSPLPSTLIALSDLRHTAPGSKVRFLGCVTKYSTKHGTLHLQHSRPTTLHKRPQKNPNVVVAVVDITLLLDTLKTTDTQTGEWVNVVGYVNERFRDGSSVEVMVKALMVWSAGAINISEYEAVVEERKNSEQIQQD